MKDRTEIISHLKKEGKFEDAYRKISDQPLDSELNQVHFK